jgi:hypothetical protein
VTTHKFETKKKITRFHPGAHTTKSASKVKLASGVKKNLSKFPTSVRLPGRAATGTIAMARYAKTYGQKFKGGVRYQGRWHRHWTRRSYSNRWGCWCWFCPSARCWYYWCGAQDCYYPVNCMNEFPPSTGDEMPPDCENVPQAGEGEEPDVPQ